MDKAAVHLQVSHHRQVRSFLRRDKRGLEDLNDRMSARNRIQDLVTLVAGMAHGQVLPDQKANLCFYPAEA